MLVARPGERSRARSDEGPMLEGFGIEGYRVRGGAGRATSGGGRGDPEASCRALPGFRVVDFPARGGERRLRAGEQGAGRRTSRRALQPVSATVRVARRK